jgi:hypothetical protein
MWEWRENSVNMAWENVEMSRANMGVTELTKAYAWAMLRQDRCFGRISESLARSLLDRALAAGVGLALEIERRQGHISALDLCRRLHIAVTPAKLELPGRLVRAVYTHDPLEIKLNRQCLPLLAEQVRQLLAREKAGAAEAVEPLEALTTPELPGLSEPRGVRAPAELLGLLEPLATQATPEPLEPLEPFEPWEPLETLAMEMILAHELFHYYERQEPERNPQLAPELIRGQWIKRRIRLQSLSEIAAHSFAQAFLRLPFYPGQLDIQAPATRVLEHFRQPAMPRPGGG